MLMFSLFLGLVSSVPCTFELDTRMQSANDVTRQLNYLTGDSILVQGTNQFMSGKNRTPRSFTSDLGFWGDYVCSRADCRVNDIIRVNPFSVLGQDPSAESTRLQIERVLSTAGINVYDGAMWQIALGLAAYLGQVDYAMANNLIRDQQMRLRRLDSKAQAPDPVGGWGGFTYGPQKAIIRNLQYAYTLRLLGPKFMVEDPFKNTKYGNLVGTPPGMVEQGFDKHISWSDYKPITGENTWGNLIGPLQAAVLLYGNEPANVPFNHLAIQNAIEFLWALQNQQTVLGAFYYATDGSTDNDGEPIPQGTVSNENNFSALAGITMLKETLIAIGGSGQPLSLLDKAKIKTAVNAVNIMIYGGRTPQGRTQGLLAYFKNYAKDPLGDLFIQGGRINGSNFDAQGGCQSTFYAVDVNTWGVTALGPRTVDSLWGKGFSYKVWEDLKRRSAYIGDDGKLWGVGYSDNAQEQVFSGEWSFGALNMLQIMINYYEHTHEISPAALASLKADEQSILDHITLLRTDKYQTSYARLQDGLPPQDQVKLKENEQAFIYCSKRTYIPFGWYGNPIPALASTTWAVLMSYRFNPFRLGGSQNSKWYDLTRIPSYDPESYQLAWDPSVVTVLNRFHDSLMKVSVKRTGSDQYVDVVTPEDPIQTGGYRQIKITDDIAEISLAYRNERVTHQETQYYGACKLPLTPDLRQKLRRLPLHTAIESVWSSDGSARCNVFFAASDYEYRIPTDLTLPAEPMNGGAP